MTYANASKSDYNLLQIRKLIIIFVNTCLFLYFLSFSSELEGDSIIHSSCFDCIRPGLCGFYRFFKVFFGFNQQPKDTKRLLLQLSAPNYILEDLWIFYIFFL